MAKERLWDGVPRHAFGFCAAEGFVAGICNDILGQQEQRLAPQDDLLYYTPSTHCRLAAGSKFRTGRSICTCSKQAFPNATQIRVKNANALLPSGRGLLELLLLSEEHGETYNGAVDEQAADDAHDHCFDTDHVGVGKDYREGCGRDSLAGDRRHVIALQIY